ncbi:hypothetical protein ANG2_1809, partial [Streptococcus constellatus subsp. constellatus SK53]
LFVIKIEGHLPLYLSAKAEILMILFI